MLDDLHHQLADALRFTDAQLCDDNCKRTYWHGASVEKALAAYDAAKKECDGLREHMEATSNLNAGVYDAEVTK